MGTSGTSASFMSVRNVGLSSTLALQRLTINPDCTDISRDNRDHSQARPQPLHPARGAAF
jgi:hypothetical protein